MRVLLIIFKKTSCDIYFWCLGLIQNLGGIFALFEHALISHIILHHRPSANFYFPFHQIYHSKGWAEKSLNEIGLNFSMPPKTQFPTETLGIRIPPSYWIIPFFVVLIGLMSSHFSPIFFLIKTKDANSYLLSAVHPKV